MKTKLYILTMLFAVFGMFVISACGNDDENMEIPVVEDDDDGSFPPVFFNPDDMPEMGVVIKYYLFNQNGERTTEFKYGDDIIFDLSITNVTDSVVEINDPASSHGSGNPKLLVSPWEYDSSVKNGIFNVKTSKGSFIGYPYDPKYMEGKDRRAQITYTFLTPYNYNEDDSKYYAFYFYPNSIRWTASWSGTQYEGFMSGWRDQYYKIGVDNEPLKPGNYYTEFDINLTNRITKTVRVDFTVTE